MKKTTIDPTMLKRIEAAAYHTWQAIGSDIIACCEGKYPSNPVIREVISDAGHMEMYGGDKEAVEFFQSLPFKEQNQILQKLTF